MNGPALSRGAATSLDEFIAGLADGSINLFTGPLNYQDGTPFLADGEVATDVQIWYTEQLLEGMVGSQLGRLTPSIGDACNGGGIFVPPPLSWRHPSPTSTLGRR